MDCSNHTGSITLSVNSDPMKPMKTICALFLAAALSACSKDGGDSGRPGSLSGNIIHEYTTEVKKINLSDWSESTFFTYSAYSTVDWDVSKDGKLRLISERPAGVYDQNKFILVNVADGTIMKEFMYKPLIGNSTSNSGEISFDNSQILINPDYDNGVVIIDMDGQVKHRLDGINDKKLGLGDRARWLPGNSILVSFDGKYLLKADPPYTNLTLVKEMNYEQWGNVRVSRDGQKVSMYIGNHIYLMNIDGSNLTQVTESGSAENFAEFSPDGKHLLVGCEYIHAPVSGRSNWKLKVIPADGQLYNLDNSDEVIPIVPSQTSERAKASGNSMWRP